MRRELRCRVWWHRAENESGAIVESAHGCYVECAHCGRLRAVDVPPVASFVEHLGLAPAV